MFQQPVNQVRNLSHQQKLGSPTPLLGVALKHWIGHRRGERLRTARGAQQSSDDTCIGVSVAATGQCASNGLEVVRPFPQVPERMRERDSHKAILGLERNLFTLFRVAHPFSNFVDRVLLGPRFGSRECAVTIADVGDQVTDRKRVARDGVAASRVRV
jgi:hypothetical protein